MKILLPVDGSEYTKRVLSYLAAHDELLPGEHDYLAVTVLARIPTLGSRVLERSTVDDYYHSRAEQIFGPIRAFAKMQDWKLREHVAYGEIADAIATLAHEEKPTLIVMGTHGHSALGNLVMGSVATGVLARCKVPVLLVR